MPHYMSYDGVELSYRVLEGRVGGAGERGGVAAAGGPGGRAAAGGSVGGPDERVGPGGPEEPDEPDERGRPGEPEEPDEPDGRGRPGGPLVCLAGGPGRDAAYLGDLGGLDTHRTLIIPDSRGTGASPPSPEPWGYAFPALAEDLESLRAHLGLESFALLAHDAACATAQAYAAQYGHRLTRLVLVTPGSRLQGELPDDAEEIFESRAAEDWWTDAYVAVHTLPTTADMAEVRSLLLRAAPMGYGRWDAPQRAHAATEPDQLGPVPRAGFWQGVDDPARHALLSRLPEVGCPVLVITGDRDALTGMRAGELVASSFRTAAIRTLHGVGHYPWVDEPDLFRPVVESFLQRGHDPEARGGA